VPRLSCWRRVCIGSTTPVNGPTSLEALVPTYLPAVPIDVFAVTRQPMGYVRSMVVDGIETPVVYSVGADGVDQHGSGKPVSRNASRISSGSRRGSERMRRIRSCARRCRLRNRRRRNERDRPAVRSI